MFSESVTLSEVCALVKVAIYQRETTVSCYSSRFACVVPSLYHHSTSNFPSDITFINRA